MYTCDGWRDRENHYDDFNNNDNDNKNNNNNDEDDLIFRVSNDTIYVGRYYNNM